MGEVMQIDEAPIRDHFGEDNARYRRRNAGCGRPTNCAELAGTSAQRSARTRGQAVTSGSLDTKAGSMKLKIPKLRRQTFDTAIIERYQRRESGHETLSYYGFPDSRWIKLKNQQPAGADHT